MRLTDLAQNAQLSLTGLNVDLSIAGLTADSRQVAPGFLFAALPGSKQDGRGFIADAIAKGAVAILAPLGTALPANLNRQPLLLTDANPRAALAKLAAAFYGRQPSHIACVTGTSGKTSSVHFLRELWGAIGHKAASLGTLGVIPERKDAPKALTTPDPIELHRCLAALAKEGVEHVAMEASSHGLDQYRLEGVKVEAAAFTNLSRDHLDYHPTMEAYLAAKARLFSELLPIGGAAVLNADVPEYAQLAAIAKDRGLRLIDYGRKGQTITLLRQELDAQGQTLDLRVLGKESLIRLNVPGSFQAMNALAALGLALGCGADPIKATAALEKLSGVPGRLELAARTPSGGIVLVDYAHKPGALESVLQTLRPHTAKRLFVVVGCGGDRDRGKRPVMGRIAATLADVAIITDDNPRSEDPAAIRREILAGAPGLIEIGDRRKAIATAMRQLKAGDLLVIAGKGHESGQTVGDITLPFDDREVAREILAELEAGA